MSNVATLAAWCHWKLNELNPHPGDKEFAETVQLLIEVAYAAEAYLDTSACEAESEAEAFQLSMALAKLGDLS